MKLKTIFSLAASVAAVSPYSGAAAQSAGVTGDTDIPGKPTPNIGVGFVDISGDGAAIAGIIRVDATTYTAYRITTSGYEALPGVSGHAYVLTRGISDDGSVVVGSSAATYTSRSSAVIWKGTTLTQLGHLATTSALQGSVAFGVSGDGHVVVGASTNNSGALHAVRWVDEGAPQDLNGGNFLTASARRASRDGGVIVGNGGSNAYSTEGFVWTQSGGMVGLGVLAADVGGTYAASYATDVSADGAVVIGYSRGRGNSDLAEAFRWTNSGGLVGLGFLSGGTDSRAQAINADGSVIVGSATHPGVYIAQEVTAFRWSSSGGMQTVGDWLTANGVSAGSSTFTDALGVSDDGNVVIGTGQINGSTQQYIARVTPGSGSGTGGGNTGGGTGGGDTGGGTGGGDTGGGTGGGVIGLVDYLYTVAQGGGVTLQSVVNAANLTLFGAHHRPLMDYQQNGDNCGWITGDFAGSGRSHRRNYSGEIGICHDFGDSVRVGFGGGVDATDIDLGLGGKSKTDGYHLIGEIDVQPQGSPLLLSVTGYYADWNVKIDRAYQNGASLDMSHGRTDAKSWAMRGRIDWLDMLRFGEDSGFSPYVAYSHGEVKLDGFTETGGAFPLALSDTKAELDELRLGGQAHIAITETSKLQLSGEWVHRFDNEPAELTGDIIGVGAFAVSSPAPQDDWGRVGVDLDLGLSRTTQLSFSGHVMLGHGEDARLGGSVSFRIAF